MTPARALPLLAAVLALTACGAAEEDAPAPETESLEQVSELPSMTAAPSPTPSEAAFPEAADGQDYGACADNTCEILVIGQASVDSSMGPLDVSVADDSVTIYSGGTTMSMGEGGTAIFGDTLTIEMLAVEGDRAVLNFIPGQPA
ncbi:hypothetical protein [Glycomyces harbinensis]|uniref:Uncharacterized protein n=1 Tax=Glycomyces harbinensis TaxID=58114 RepID=A0A1G7ACP9_9ACTN|nr:hypothetical protein [Glycomyces harbinensis]SDE12550.1 hypothetical protein SAMN05216270_11365 [Glycomyces harbinensis]